MDIVEREKTLKQRLTDGLQPTHLAIVNESAQHAGHPGAAHGAGHYAVEITAECFEGKSPVERHQMVYQAVGDLIGPEIHALRIKASVK